MTTQTRARFRKYSVNGREFLAHDTCGSSFKEDRKHGLIYPSYLEDDGSFISTEKASLECRFCAYCGPSSMEGAE